MAGLNPRARSSVGLERSLCIEVGGVPVNGASTYGGSIKGEKRVGLALLAVPSRDSSASPNREVVQLAPLLKVVFLRVDIVWLAVRKHGSLDERSNWLLTIRSTILWGDQYC
jgi:hypothetical protein